MKRIKKAFTLVELVVVIAIIAILSSISFITYFGIAENAKKRVDESLINQINNILIANSKINEKPKFPRFALKIVEENGIDVLNTEIKQKDKELLWLEEENVFVIEDKIKDNSKASFNRWRFIDDYKENYGYSVYLKDGNSLKSLDIETNFDSGDYIDLNLSYIGNNNSRIYTSGGTLVNSSSNVLEHYGFLDSYSSLENGEDSFYHEFGEIRDVIHKSGTFVAENGARIEKLTCQDISKVIKKEEAYIKDILEIDNESEDIFKVGNRFYQSFKKMISEISDNEVAYLLKNIDYKLVFDDSNLIDKKIYFDLNGNNIEFGSNEYLIILGVNFTLDIINTSSDIGKVINSKTGEKGIDIQEGSLIIESGIYSFDPTIFVPGHGNLTKTTGESNFYATDFSYQYFVSNNNDYFWTVTRSKLN